MFEVNEEQTLHRIDAGSVGTIVNVASVSGFIAQPEFVYVVFERAHSNITKYVKRSHTGQHIQGCSDATHTMQRHGSCSTQNTCQHGMPGNDRDGW